MAERSGPSCTSTAAIGDTKDFEDYFKDQMVKMLLKEPQPIRRRIKALKNLMAKSMEVERKFHDDVTTLERKYENDYSLLYDKRASIISGKYEPSDQECLFQEDTDETYDLLQKARQDDNKVSGGEGDELVQGIPNFWLEAMKNVGALAGMIESHDEPVLQYLENVSVQLCNDPCGFKIMFHFAPNEYFTNRVLSKLYVTKNEVDQEAPLTYSGPEIVSSAGCKINWKPGKDITGIFRERPLRGGRSGAKAEEKVLTRKYKLPSFFDFFNPPENTNSMTEEVMYRQTRDFDLGQFLRETFIPQAVVYYTGEADLSSEEDDSTEEDSDEDFDLEKLKVEMANLKVETNEVSV